MASISHQQRSKIRKARQRDPIVSVFLYHQPNTTYSISVPASKSWSEFLTKIRKQFKLPSESCLSLYRPQTTTDDHDDTSNQLNLSNKYDLEESDMAKIKHQTTFCVKIIDDSDSNDSDDSNTNSDRNKMNKSRKKKRKRKRSVSDSDSSSHDTSSSSDAAASESKMNGPNGPNQLNFGLDLDLFDRPCTAKKAHSKKNSKPIYHFHSQSTIQSLDFHLKSAWSDLKKHPMSVHHVDDQYTLMQSADKQFTLRFVD